MYNSGYQGGYSAVGYPQFQTIQQGVPQYQGQMSGFQNGNPTGYPNGGQVSPVQQNAQQQMPSAQQMQNIQQLQTVQQPQRIQEGGYVEVQSEEEARHYPVVHGYSVTFKNGNSNPPYLYKKTVGYSLLDAPVFEKWRLIKEEDQQTGQQPVQQTFATFRNDSAGKVSSAKPVQDVNYANRSEIETLSSQIERLNGIIDELKASFKTMQDDIDNLSITTKKTVPVKAKKDEASE